MAIDDGRLFFEHIGAKIAILAKAYKNIAEDFQELGSGAVADVKKENNTVNYTIILNRLNRAINDFKREMKRSLQDYYIIISQFELSPNSARHIESNLNVLHDEYARFSKDVSEEVIEKGLGRNYFFHKNLKKLTVETLLDYFETNYLLHMEKEED